MQEKPHRLDSALYHGHRAIAFTCCVAQRQNCFRDASAVRAVENILLQSLTKYNANAHVYLFMPDHLHVLLEGKDAQTDLYECIVHFKQRSGFWLVKHAGVRWQKDFYDHILRKEDEIEKQVRYILENPVRKGITDDWKSYSYKGSTVYDFGQW